MAYIIIMTTSSKCSPFAVSLKMFRLFDEKNSKGFNSKRGSSPFCKMTIYLSSREQPTTFTRAYILLYYYTFKVILY